jgi:chemotaxis protein CheX
VDVRFINPFITSSRQVFDMMIHLPLKIDKPSLRTHGAPHYAVSAAIGIGGAMKGCVVLGFSQQIALALASGLMQKPHTALDSDCVDALGEIVNMIAGSAKKMLPGGLSTLSVPNVILGSHQIQYPAGVPVIVIPCRIPIGQFVIEVAITAGESMDDAGATATPIAGEGTPAAAAEAGPVPA